MMYSENQNHSGNEVGRHKDEEESNFLRIKNEQQYMYLMQQFLATEEAYLSHLGNLCMHLDRTPLRIREDLLPRDTLKSLAKQLLEAHTYFYSQLNDNEKQIEDCIAEQLPKLYLYIEYAECAEEVASLLINEKYYVAWQNVRTLLLAPLQYIVRYENFVHNLFLTRKNVKMDVLVRPLEELKKQVEKVTSKIRAFLKKQNNSYKILEIQRHLVNGQPKIFIPRRQLLRQGTLLKVNGTLIRKRIFFMFNDMLMYCKAGHQAEKLVCCGVFALANCSVDVVLGGDSQDAKSLFRVTHENGKSLLLFSQKPGVSATWVLALQKAISKAKYSGDKENTRILGRRKPVQLPQKNKKRQTVRMVLKLNKLL